MKAEFLAALQATAAVKPKEVDVPGWPTVYVRAITVAEVEAQAEDTANKDDKHRIARGAARVMCDVDGNRLIDPDNQDEVNLLASQPWALLRYVLEGSEAFNATSEKARDEAKNG
ncbi:hypothetical protein [Variovorax boronicumulans]|uniref:hypothetical protein n=1 Tax=Variovorax boronicumulans TaxID=436515 RepID=UPI001C581CBA